MKNAFFSTAFILLFTFIIHGFSLKNLLWYFIFVVILTPVVYFLNKYILKPLIKKFFNFKEVEEIE